MRFFLASICLLIGTLCTQAETKRPPNIVVFLVDDLGNHDLGCTGSTFYETPNIDRLAKEGMRFRQGYTPCPVCSPTRAALITGCWPQRSDITNYIGAPQPEKWNQPTAMLPATYAEQLDHKFVTLAEALKPHGYSTMHAGKWHLGREPFFPEKQGFDVNRAGVDAGGPYTGSKYFSPYKNPRLEDKGPAGVHLADRLADECCEFMTANKDKPFFVNFWFYDVHTPLMGKPELVKKYEEKAKAVGPVVWGQEGSRKVRQTQNHAVYAAMVETMDTAVGTVLKKLDSLGLRENTIIVFTSDNGGLSTSEGSPTSNLPLRAGKGLLYEGGVRVPFIVRYPGQVAAGAVSDRVIVSNDVFATLMDASQLPPVADAKDSVSFWPTLLQQKQEPRGPLYWHFPHYGNQGGFPGGAIRVGDWKLIERYETGTLELYNLAQDPSEQKNLAETEKPRVQEMHQQLKAWRQETQAKMPTFNPKAKK